MRFYVFALCCMAPVLVNAQPSTALIEACNAVPNQGKRLACLKEAMQGVTTKAQPLATATSTPSELTLTEAAAICDSVMTGLQKKRDLASEDASLSSASELVVTWPAVEGKLPTLCNVDRSTKKILSLSSNGHILSGRLMADMDRTMTFQREIQSGNYANFVAYAKTGITASFKDPASAQFKSLFISRKKAPVLCGELNGKNSYGAFVGFRRFYSAGIPSLDAIEDVKSNYVFEAMWPTMCGEKVADIE